VINGESKAVKDAKSGNGTSLILPPMGANFKKAWF
jgi:hypothetical protein